MKKGNLFMLAQCLLIVVGMYTTNLVLKDEYQKIDLTDPYKNYVSLDTESYAVLNISGSNGYPIEVRASDRDQIKVLRSRMNHFSRSLKNDTLFIQFTGSNISLEQGRHSKTPPGIVIEKKVLLSVSITDTYNRIIGFSNQDLALVIKGNAFVEVHDCELNTLKIDMKHNSQIAFMNANKVDTLDIKMLNAPIAYLENAAFNSIKHNLSDSAAFVLSSTTFKHLLR